MVIFVLVLRLSTEIPLHDSILTTRLGDSGLMIVIYVPGWFDVIVIYVLDDLIVNFSRE